MASELRNWLKAEGRQFFRDIGIEAGQSILDFGCGAGHYTIPVAKAVGERGIVYALDMDRTELSRLTKEANSEGINNIRPVQASSVRAVGLEEGSIDVALLFDVLHYMAADDRNALYDEIHRILKGDGRLLVYPKHVKSDQPLWNLRDMNLDDVMEEIETADFSLEDQSTQWLLHDDNYNTGMLLRFRKQGSPSAAESRKASFSRV